MEGTRKEEQPINIAQQHTQTGVAQICQTSNLHKNLQGGPIQRLTGVPTSSKPQIKHEIFDNVKMNYQLNVITL